MEFDSKNSTSSIADIIDGCIFIELVFDISVDDCINFPLTLEQIGIEYRAKTLYDTVKQLLKDGVINTGD